MSEQENADVIVDIHPKIRPLLDEELWLEARQAAGSLREAFVAEGYQPDGLRVLAGETWPKRFEKRG